jgi:2-desacetyl-2-hydroxyethyl bacteriochlorophyllide A dehydrogenase
MRYRRIVFTGPRKVEIKEDELPEPSSNQILIKTRMTLISTGTELTMLSGDYPKGSVWNNITRYPVFPGYSNCGVVEKVGSDVKKFTIGDRVSSTAPHAEYAIVREDRAVKVPEEVSDEEATFGTLSATVMNSVRLADIKLGESVIIVGAGILGQLACQFSRLCGGYPVVAVDLSRRRLEIAKRLGATYTINPREEDAEERVKEVTGGRGGDVVFEVTGNPKVIPWELSLVKRQGRLILLSSPRGRTELDFHDLVNWPSRVIIGTHTSSHPSHETPYNPWTWERNIQLFFEFLSAGLVNVKDLITDRYRWTEAEKVYQRLLDPLGERLQALGVILDFGE